MANHAGSPHTKHKIGPKMTLLSRPSDPNRDFCQWPYEPWTAPTPDGLRQEAILNHALKLLDTSGKTQKIIKDIQQQVGQFNTVWGLKSQGDRASIELYFYDYERDKRRINYTEIKNAMPEFFDPELHINEDIPFFMWSMEINPQAPDRISEIDIYCNGAGGTISGGECFTLSKSGCEFKNLYSFFEIPRDAQIAVETLTSGPRLAGLAAFPAQIYPGASQEEVYVVARKRHNDAVYLSRMPLHCTISILETVHFSKPILDFVKEQEKSLQHHRFDVGIDFIVGPEANMKITKSGLYGIF